MRKFFEITTVVPCPIDCRFCPQPHLKKAYKSKQKRMTFEVFKTCVDKIPADMPIAFAGMAEPWINRECTKMLNYVVEKGHQVLIFSTLMFCDDADIDAIVTIPPDRINELVIHVPDSWGFMKFCGKDWNDYNKKLQRIGAAFSQCVFVSHANYHAKVFETCMSRPANQTMHSRGGNLDDSLVHTINHEGPLICGIVGDELCDNILMPDGTVVLCCMDYSMEHVLGNLIDQSYDDIYKSAEKEKVKKLQQDDVPSLCRKCSYAQSRTCQ